ncbi:hypothetical protein [Pseudoxanthomonas sp.]|uniref:hypothetical protein n=1 Tax=Pseudoxanthomonas sp. TaxID=1871049 RepID=UPI002FE37D23
MDIVMKTAALALPDHFAWHRTDAGHDLCVGGMTVAQVHGQQDEFVLRILVDMGDIAPFDMAIRCEERAVAWVTQWACQRAGLLDRYATRQRTSAGDSAPVLALAAA